MDTCARLLRKTVPWLVLAIPLMGCRAPDATLDLIRVSRKALQNAATNQAEMNEQLFQLHQAQLRSLDSAFDADVKLIAAGQIKDADGKPLTLNSEWVISARKGYISVRDRLGEQIRKDQAAHSIGQDNLRTAGEALEMAEELIVLQWSISLKLRQQFLKLWRKSNDAKPNH